MGDPGWARHGSGRLGDPEEFPIIRKNRIDDKTGRIDDKIGRIDDKIGRIDDKTRRIDDKIGRIDDKSPYFEYFLYIFYI